MAILKDLLVNGNSSLLGTTTAVSILPQTDASYNLGSSGFGWNTIYLDKASDDNARHQGIRFLNDTTEVANIGATSIGLGLYGNGNVYIRPSLTATNQGFTITSTAIVPAANNTIDLGQHSTTDNTIKYRWKNIYLQGVLDYIMDANTSNAKTQLRIKDTANTSIAEIGFINTGDTNGAFYIVPAFKNITGNSYNGQNGLYIGKNNLKWENKYLLRYSATATTDQLLIADGTVGDVKTSGKTITTDAPTSSSNDTTIPTSAAVWSAVDDRLFSCSGMAPGKSSSDWYKIYEYPIASSGTYNYTIMFNDTYDTTSGGPIQASNAIVQFYLNRDGSGNVTATARYLAQTHFSADRIAYYVDTTDTNNKKFAIYVYNISTNQYTRVKATLLRFLTRDGESSYNQAQYFLSSNNIVDALPEGAKYPVSTIPTLEDGVLLNDNTNLNSIYDYGSYYINASAKAKLFTNNPYNDNQTLSAFTLNVMCGIGRTESSQNYRKQDLREFGRPTHFTRNTSNSSSWGNWAAYAYNPNTASTVGSSSSPIYVDKTGELKACTSIDCGEITTPKIYIYGDKTSNKTNRFINSDSLQNMYFSVDDQTVLVLLKGDTNTVRRGASANATDLGTSTYPWNNIYGNKLMAGTITVGDSTASTTGRTITSSTTLYLNRAAATSIVFQQAGTNYISIDTSNNLVPVTAQTEKLNLGLSTNKWKAVYALDFYGSGSNLTNIYVGSVAKTDTATYNTTPEVASIKVGNGTAVAAGANGCTMQYDENLQTLKFVFI